MPLNTIASVDPRARVRTMLQTLRYGESREAAATSASGGGSPSWLGAFKRDASPTAVLNDAPPRMPGAPVATPVFAHQRAAGLVGGGTRGRGGTTSTSGSRFGSASSATTSAATSDTSVIVVWIVSALALMGVFLVIGQWVDAQLVDDEEETAEKGEAGADPPSVGRDYATVALKTTFQVVFDVVLLLVPFLLLRHYANTSLLCKYYFRVVFPLWVVSLQAQPLLKERLRVLLQGEVDSDTKDDDARKLARLVAQLKRAEAAATGAAPRSPVTHGSLHRFSVTSGPHCHRRLHPRSHARPPLPARGAADGRGADDGHSPGRPSTGSGPDVQFSSPLLDGGGSVAVSPPAVVEPFEFSGKGGEAPPRHTDLSALMGA